MSFYFIFFLYPVFIYIFKQSGQSHLRLSLQVAGIESATADRIDVMVSEAASQIYQRLRLPLEKRQVNPLLSTSENFRYDAKSTTAGGVRSGNIGDDNAKEKGAVTISTPRRRAGGHRGVGDSNNMPGLASNNMRGGGGCDAFQNREIIFRPSIPPATVAEQAELDEIHLSLLRTVYAALHSFIFPHLVSSLLVKEQFLSKKLRNFETLAALLAVLSRNKISDGTAQDRTGSNVSGVPGGRDQAGGAFSVGVSNGSGGGGEAHPQGDDLSSSGAPITAKGILRNQKLMSTVSATAASKLRTGLADTIAPYEKLEKMLDILQNLPIWLAKGYQAAGSAPASSATTTSINPQSHTPGTANMPQLEADDLINLIVLTLWKARPPNLLAHLAHCDLILQKARRRNHEMEYAFSIFQSAVLFFIYF